MPGVSGVESRVSSDKSRRADQPAYGTSGRRRCRGVGLAASGVESDFNRLASRGREAGCPTVLSVDEVRRVIAAVPEHRMSRLLLELTYGTGMRVSEVCTLRVRDIDLGRAQSIRSRIRHPDDRDVPSYTKSLEHLVRYCARPAFALERLSVVGGGGDQPERILYTLPRHKRGQWVGSGRQKKPSPPDAQGVVTLSPHEFLDRLADLVPPPRKHRHRYHGVFAPNHPLRPLVTALAIGNAGKSVGPGCGEPGPARPLGQPDGPSATETLKRSHDTSRIAWAKLLARIAERFPVVCPACGGDIRLISFITDPAPIRKILAHVGEPVEPPPVSPARGPPTEWPELVQAHDDRDVMQASPDELPEIDIHSL